MNFQRAQATMFKKNPSPHPHPYRASGLPAFQLPLLLCVLSFYTSACVTSGSQLLSLNDDMEQLNRQVEELEKDQYQSLYRRREILNELRELVQTESPIISGRTKMAEQKIVPSSIQPQPNEQITSSPLNPVTQTDSIVPASGEATQLFRTSYAKYNQGNYEQAAEGFLLAYQYAREPEVKVACLFGLGECHYRMKEWRKAVQCFTQLESEYPNHTILPTALLKKGYSYLQLQEREKGIAALQTLVTRYPGTEEAELAQERLNLINQNL
ncbi:MAG: tetratricopeptide repeat protein [bacterium]